MNEKTSNYLEQRIKSLRAIILDNPYENIMYNESILGNTKDVLITSLSPTTFESDTVITINCEIENGIKVPPGTLQAMGGTFTNSETGQVLTADSVIISDPATYSNIQIVSSGLQGGDYAITILLSPMGKGGDMYRLTSEQDIEVKPSLSLKISSIIPNTISLKELQGATFSIKGRSLNQIQTSTGFYMQTPGYKFTFAGILQPTSARVVYRSSSLPEAGMYRILARSKEGTPAFSSAQLRVED